MEPDETYREAHRRSHRLLGSYLALWAWAKKVDCVVLVREQLLPFLELERMQDKRIDWMKDDLKKLFPHFLVTWDSVTKGYATLYLSRLPIPSGALQDGMTNEEHVNALAGAGLSAKIATIPHESEIVRILALITHGIWDSSDNPA